MDATLYRLAAACKDYAALHSLEAPTVSDRATLSARISASCEHATDHPDAPFADAVINADNAFADSCQE